jgi:hypothetical protein
MAVNEDSVVSSLNELRRMANDRARRETEARQRQSRVRAQEIHGGMSPEVNRTLMGMGGGPGGPEQWVPQGEARSTQAGFSYAQAYGYAPAADGSMPRRSRSAAGAVLMTMIIMGAAAAAGYWKLQREFQATLRARDAAIASAEDARNKAVEMASRAEQLARAAVKGKGGPAMEKAAAALEKAADATPAPAAPAAAAAPKTVAAAPKAGKMGRVKHGRRAAAARKVAAARAAAIAAAAPAEEKKPAAPMPKIAGKKKITDDPLAGLKL